MSGSNSSGRNLPGWRWLLGGVLLLGVVLVWIPRSVYIVVGSFAFAHWRALVTGVVVVGLAPLAGSTVVVRKCEVQKSDSEGGEKKPLVREIPGWAIWAGMFGLVAVGLLAAWWLVSRYGSGDPATIDQNRVKLEAIKLAGSIIVGTGGVAALLLAARRQRVNELDLLQKDRVADDNRHDANERRATELYTAAAEQLASDKAPVRMAGMYALSRLGEDNKNLRQTIANLLCAYLRMPEISLGEATPVAAAPDGQEDDKAYQRSEDYSRAMVLDLAAGPLAALTALAPDLSAQKQQERQVRLTAQRLLTQHLRSDRGEDGKPTNARFWPDMDIDLADASLHEWDFARCEVHSADFSGARFGGDAFFDEARFGGRACFDGAWFEGGAGFGVAWFGERATFKQTHFDGGSWFDGAKFQCDAYFDDAQFGEGALFSPVWFAGRVRFENTVFENPPDFENAWVCLDAVIRKGSVWPTGWDVQKKKSNDACKGRWGVLFPTASSA